MGGGNEGQSLIGQRNRLKTEGEDRKDKEGGGLGEKKGEN